MELDLQSLFGLHVHTCTYWLTPPPPTPTFGLIYENAIAPSKIDDISLWSPGPTLLPYRSLTHTAKENWRRAEEGRLCTSHCLIYWTDLHTHCHTYTVTLPHQSFNPQLLSTIARTYFKIIILGGRLDLDLIHHQRMRSGWDLAELLERQTANTEAATVLGSVPASSGTVKSKGRQMKQCWIKYGEKIQKIPL